MGNMRIDTKTCASCRHSTITEREGTVRSLDGGVVELHRMACVHPSVARIGPPEPIVGMRHERGRCGAVATLWEARR